MPQLPDLHISALSANDSEGQLQSLVKQLNDWARAVSNENTTNVYNDNTGIARIIIGVLPDGDTGIVISKPGIDVLTAFS